MFFYNKKVWGWVKNLILKYDTLCVAQNMISFKCVFGLLWLLWYYDQFYLRQILEFQFHKNEMWISISQEWNVDLKRIVNCKPQFLVKSWHFQFLNNWWYWKWRIFTTIFSCSNEVWKILYLICFSATQLHCVEILVSRPDFSVVLLFKKILRW